ncbi:hypothetical protein N7532_007186 [Penicillium argentinense]|uniref:HD/PDEase domain-containing protein n=1 Tax=Penicillium argentinense TaxID=1131581 RepID=A0A9W9F790_9EURO|nr:uncharacterized protein N7532_007186 [Penicillium argentinense]KAJ5094895.1 hypothetical protein N7532_007186 [Penicillium argentinense]
MSDLNQSTKNMKPLDLFSQDPLVNKAAIYVKDYMSRFDASHDWQHILRVMALAHRIYHTMTANSQHGYPLSLRTITLSALLHDVTDTKYLVPSQTSASLITNLLVDWGAERSYAWEIQSICEGVSYRTEVKDPLKVQELLQKYPELAVVQDADRLDAIGAIGIGRCFTYGGAKTTRSLDDSVAHFDEKLLHVAKMMKTDVGLAMAKSRTERLEAFKNWWCDESILV